MIIFITIPWFAPAYKAGGPVQSIINMVQRFNENIAYYIFCSNTDLNGELLPQVQTNQWISYNEYTKVWYAAGVNKSRSMQQQIKIVQPSALFIVGLFSWEYNVKPLFFSTVPHTILSVRGMLHSGALSQKKLKKQLFLALLKLTGRIHAITFHATDEDEKVFIEKAFGKKVVTKIAANYASRLAYITPPIKVKDELNLMSVALISPMKNHLIVLQALQVCNQKIIWNIYGPVKDAAYWDICLAAIKNLPANITVLYHGDLNPADKEKAFTDNHVFILPSRSENFGHAFTEAFTAGRPVITSNGTPWNMLQKAGAGINVQPAKEEIAVAIQFFAAMQNEEYLRCSHAATQYAITQIKEDTLKDAYKNLFVLAG